MTKTMTELQKLQQRWRKKTKEEMPANITCLPIEKVRKAVDWTEKGITVVVPPLHVEEVQNQEPGSSLRNWDGHNNQ